ncbi:MAG: sugar ABC transporter ATP-binding protein [Candidatus Sumerlaeaceae bacterium]
MSTPSNPSPRFEMRAISKRFGATIALSDVKISVSPGEVLALVGENGAGKSTLMKVLSGAIQPDTGKMVLDGLPYAPRDPKQARSAGVAMIYQELSLAPHLTVEQNISLGSEPGIAGVLNLRQMRKVAHNALAQLDHPEIPTYLAVQRLPLAARQLVEIARAIAVGARVLVLDEPTGTLAQADVEKLFGLIERLKKQGYAIVYISHFLEEVLRIADRYIILRDGKTAGEGSTAGASPELLADLMVGRKLGSMYMRSARTPGEIILQVEDLGGTLKPELASLKLHRGEVLGIAGLVGAGRTEFLRCLFGLDAVRRGKIRMGVHTGPASPHDWLRHGLGLVSEDRKTEGLALQMSIGDNLTLSRPASIPSRRNRAAVTWIQKLAVRCRGPRQIVGSLSGGNQQKVAIARLLHHDVDVLLLDEPTRGIDVGSKAQVYRLIDELVTGPNPKAVLLVSSSLQELLGVCDRVAVMHRGRLGVPRAAEEWSEHTLMLAASGTAQEAA